MKGSKFVGSFCAKMSGCPAEFDVRHLERGGGGFKQEETLTAAGSRPLVSHLRVMDQVQLRHDAARIHQGSQC